MFGHENFNKLKSEIEEEEKRESDKDFVELMKQPAFRRFMWRLMEMGKPFQSSFTGNSTTFFNEGLKVLALFIFTLIMRLCPDKYVQMAREHNSKVAQRKKEIERKLIKEGIIDDERNIN